MDSKPFQQYKHYHGLKVNSEARLGITHFDKKEFLNALQEIRQNTFKPSTIRRGFAETAIYPYNPSQLLDELEKKTIPVPPVELWDGDTPPPTTEPPTTPQTIRSLRRNVEALESSLQLSPSSRVKLKRVFKGSITQAELNAQREQLLRVYANSIKQRTAPTTRRRVQGEGAMTVEDASRKIEDRKMEELIKEVRKMEKLKKKEQNQPLSRSTFMGQLDRDFVEGRREASDLADEELFVIDSNSVA